MRTAVRRRLFLLSNSTVFGRPYLEHALAGLQDFLGDERSVLFGPFALANYDGHTAYIQAALAPLARWSEGCTPAGIPGKR